MPVKDGAIVIFILFWLIPDGCQDTGLSCCCACFPDPCFPGQGDGTGVAQGWHRDSVVGTGVAQGFCGCPFPLQHSSRVMPPWPCASAGHHDKAPPAPQLLPLLSQDLGCHWAVLAVTGLYLGVTRLSLGVTRLSLAVFGCPWAVIGLSWLSLVVTGLSLGCPCADNGCPLAVSGCHHAVIGSHQAVLAVPGCP